MNSAGIALQRRLELVAIHASRVLEHGSDSIPCSSAGGFCARCQAPNAAGTDTKNSGAHTSAESDYSDPCR